MLQTNIVHTKQQAGQQSYHHYDHRPFQIHCIANVTTIARRCIRHEKERFKRIKGRMQFTETAPGFKIGFDSIQYFLNPFITAGLVQFLNHQIDTLPHNGLDIIFRRINKLTQSQILVNHLIDTQILHLINVSGQNSLKQIERIDIHR